MEMSSSIVVLQNEDILEVVDSFKRVCSISSIFIVRRTDGSRCSLGSMGLGRGSIGSCFGRIWWTTNGDGSSHG